MIKLSFYPRQRGGYGCHYLRFEKLNEKISIFLLQVLQLSGRREL
jgi:hypothetical protein